MFQALFQERIDKVPPCLQGAYILLEVTAITQTKTRCYQPGWGWSSEESGLDSDGRAGILIACLVGRLSEEA